MNFDLFHSVEILSRTPAILSAMLTGLSEEWIYQNEGDNTWSPYEVIGHLIHGEKTDWIVRAKIILSDAEDKTFEPFDRFAQMKATRERTIAELLHEFLLLRAENLSALKDFRIQESDLSKTGMHPELGEVNLAQLLACWVAHDLNHIAQISRVMAKQYADEVGPWSAYLGILKK